MEQNNILQTAKKALKKNNSSTIRFSKDFMRRVSKLVEKANKKPFGEKIKSRAILENLLGLADKKLTFLCFIETFRKKL